ncbi:MAG: hypothetical protein EOO66_22715 [Methylobacterium sp.]|nr:MAG: hypothetical protein EOO66_22715 [Methylobacterium sp.]
MGSVSSRSPCVNNSRRYRVDAVLVASIRLTSRFAEECARSNVPVVLINRRTDTEIASSITGDNREGGRRVAAFLMAGRHERFAFMAGLEDSSTSREREDGFRLGLQQGGSPAPARVVGHYDAEAARAAASTLLGARNPPDAIFCANDHMAFATIETARSQFGLEVGRDVSVVGFDDVPLAAWPSFLLTTYAQPIEPMVRRVVEITLRHLEPEGTEPIRETVPGELVIRRSARLPD